VTSISGKDTTLPAPQTWHGGKPGLSCAETTATKMAAMATVNFILLTDLRLKDEDYRTNWLATNCMNCHEDKL
jgi:hypothetical protein